MMMKLLKREVVNKPESEPARGRETIAGFKASVRPILSSARGKHVQRQWAYRQTSVSSFRIHKVWATSPRLEVAHTDGAYRCAYRRCICLAEKHRQDLSMESIIETLC